MRSRLVLILALFQSVFLRAQDFHFSQVMQNMVYVNPAYAAMPASGELGLVYRNQWPGIPATFVTYGASAVLPLSNIHSGLGVHVMNDVQGSGVITRSSATFQYAYLLDLGRSWQVGGGISGSYVFKRFNGSELLFRSDILNDLGYSYPTVTYDNYTRNYPDFGAGIIARNKEKLSFGFSVSHLTRPAESLSNQVSDRLPMKYTAFVSGRIANDSRTSFSDIAVEPAVYFSQQQMNQEMIWGTRVLLGQNIMVGGWMRHKLPFRPESFIAMAGLSWGHYNITYSYDVNLKKMRFLSTKMAAHEVTFLYRFEYNERSKAVCPAYL
jgi:type IX secretion system PorP/SprF family membrane protein